MIRFIIIVTTLPLLLCLCPDQPAMAQEWGSECGMPMPDPPPPEQTPAVNFGGRFTPSAGVLRVLMVWVRFADDNETTAQWPNPAVLPEWAARFVDSLYKMLVMK